MKTMPGLHNEIIVSCQLMPSLLLFVHRHRLRLIIAAPNTQKGWNLWTPQIQRSGPLNRSPRKPHRKSSCQPAHSPPALKPHQEVCVSEGTHATPVYKRVCVCVCRHQMYDVRYMNVQLKPSFPSHDFLWSDKPPAALGFTVKRSKVKHYSLLLLHVYIYCPRSVASWDRKTHCKCFEYGLCVPL